MAETLNVPTWNLDDVFPGFESEKYREAKVRIKAMLEKAKNYLVESSPTGRRCGICGLAFGRFLPNSTRSKCLRTTLSAYVYARFSTETKNPVVIAETQQNRRTVWCPRRRCSCSSGTCLHSTKNS